MLRLLRPTVLTGARAINVKRRRTFGANSIDVEFELGHEFVAAHSQAPLCFDDNCRSQRRIQTADYAAFSRALSHLPEVASAFILARWVKARWPAATFSDLPPQALRAAACKARP